MGQPARRHLRRAGPGPRCNPCGMCSPSGNSCWTNTIEPSKELATLAGPGSDPGKLAATAKAELERLQPQVAGSSPFSLPPPFNIPTTGVTEAALGEMKQAIEAAKNDLKSWQSKLEAAHAEAAKTGSNAAALRAERDKLFRSVAALKAKGQEREKAVTAAKTAEERQLARERLTNAKLEARVEDLRLKILEATQGRETSLAEVRQLNERVVDAQVQVSRKLLDQMQLRYRVLAESQQRDLKRAAATEENKAQQSDDPLDRYRARRLAELLELEAQIVKNEQSLATGTPSLAGGGARPGRSGRERVRPDQAAPRRRQRQPARRPPPEQRLPPHRAGARRPPPQRAGRDRDSIAIFMRTCLTECGARADRGLAGRPGRARRAAGAAGARAACAGAGAISPSWRSGTGRCWNGGGLP